MPAGATAPDVVLNALESMILLSGLLAAVALYAVRKWRKRISAQGQFLMDWLGAWTIVELVLIGVSSFNHDILNAIGLDLPMPVEIIKSNGLLLPISMIYCAGLVGRNTLIATLDAIREPAKTDDVEKASER